MSETIISKRCSRCKQEKPLGEFGKDRWNKDALNTRCKLCACEIATRYNASPQGRAKRKEWYKSEKGKTTPRRYRRSPKGKANARRYYLAFSQLHPEIILAHEAIRNAVRYHGHPKASEFICVHCKKSQARNYHHHKGYKKKHWFNVIPVCIPCHRFLDKCQGSLPSGPKIVTPPCPSVPPVVRSK